VGNSNYILYWIVNLHITRRLSCSCS